MNEEINKHMHISIETCSEKMYRYYTAQKPAQKPAASTKSSPSNRDPQTLKFSRNFVSTPAQLGGKTAQLATLFISKISS